MQNFHFYSPTYFAFGDGAEKELGTLIHRFNGSKVLMVYGGGSIKRNGTYDAVTKALQDSQMDWVELSGVEANPKSGKIYEGIDLFRKENCDFILAVGGGSVIDTAKAIGIGAPYDGDFWDFFAMKAPIQYSLPVGVVLTISAAGSEGSDSCVVTHESGNLKWGIPRTDVIRPKFAVLNPRFTCSLPAYQTACGMVDMFSHVCERYFTNTQDVLITDHLCEALLKTIVQTAPKVLAHPDACAPRAELMWTGMLAHNNSCGVGREQDWGSHQIEHELSALTDCAHGAGLAVVLPAWMEYVMSHDVNRFARYAVEVFGCTPNDDPQVTAREGIQRTRAFFRSLGMPSTLAELTEDASEKLSVSRLVEHRKEKPDAFPFGNFVKIFPEDMERILQLMF